jgi:adenosylmethionine-8-amino-7-oxononanoate aminotransferase
VGLASLDIFARDRVIEGLTAKIELLAGRLAAMAEHPHVGDIRQRGLMVGLELVADKSAREPFPIKRRTGHRVIMAARDLGAILRPLGDVIVLMPPLCITEGELNTLCDITLAAIDRATG